MKTVPLDVEVALLVLARDLARREEEVEGRFPTRADELLAEALLGVARARWAAFRADLEKRCATEPVMD